MEFWAFTSMWQFNSCTILRYWLYITLLTNHVFVLLRGNGASVLRIVPYAALHYMAYERYRCWILNNCPSLGTGPLVDLLAGSASGGTAVLCTYPLDLARTKLAFQVLQSTSHYCRSLWSLVLT